MAGSIVSRCSVILPGAPPPAISIDQEEVVICADSGALSFEGSNLVPDFIIGDMDSIPEDLLYRMEKKGSAILGYPEDKDTSDGELAVRLGLEFSPSRIDIYGGKEGRSDHIISTFNLLFLIPPDIEGVLHMDSEEVILVREGVDVDIQTPHPIISLLPARGPCMVSLGGLKWDLDKEELTPGSTRGIHNENRTGQFHVSVHQGDIYIVMAHEE